MPNPQETAAAKTQDNQQPQLSDKLVGLKNTWSKLPLDERSKQLDQLTAEEQATLLRALGGDQKNLEVRTQAPVGSIQWMRTKATSGLNWASQYFPAAGGTVGGIVGGVVGEAINPAGGGLPGAVTGAGIGGGVGESARQGLAHIEGWDKYEEPMTGKDRASEIGKQTAYQALYELFGQAIGKLARPSVERSVGKLTDAAGLTHGSDRFGPANLDKMIDEVMAMEKGGQGKAVTLGDFMQVLGEMKKTVGEKADAEFNIPITQNGKQVLLGDATANTQPLVKAVDEVINRLSINKDINKHSLEALKTIRDHAETARTYRQLNDWRIQIRNELDDFFGKNPSVKQVEMSVDPELAAKKKVYDAIREVVYPEMDKAAGVPKGTTQALQDKRGMLMQMHSEADKRLETLQNKAGQEKGKSIAEKMNLSTYFTSEGKPGVAAHRVSKIVHNPTELHRANSKVASAFGHGVKAKTAQAASSKVGMEILNLPVRVLTPHPDPYDVPEDEEDQNTSTPEPQSKAAPFPSPREAMEKAKRLNAGPQKVAYNHIAVNPGTGHKVGSPDGVEWYDVESGKKWA